MDPQNPPPISSLDRSDEQSQETISIPDQSFFEHFFDEAPDMFVSIDPQTAAIKYCNLALCTRLGYSRTELIGKPLKELYHPDSLDDMETLFEQFLLQGHAESDHLQLTTSTQAAVDVSLRVSSQRDADGNIVESRSIWRDISLERQVERLKLELRLAEAQKMESLALLAGGIAHDFNNMLVAILGNASLCLMELPAETPVKPRLDSIETAAQRAAELTKQLLAYSGSTNHEQTYFNASTVIEEMGHLLSVAISRKVVLNYDLAEQPVLVLGDITQIRQIVMNLLTNASDAIGDRSGMVTIRTGIQMADRSYLDNTVLGADLEPGYYGFMEISDTGVGISAESQQKMFNPFYTTKAKGHGLGLAAVLGIVRSHNGTLSVYSEPNNGTTIKIMLPAHDYVESVDQEMQDVRPAAGEHILVVDDEENVRAVTQRMLEHYEFNVTVAVDGREALAIYSAAPANYDLILLDMSMPHLDGIGAYKAITALGHDIKILFMSGYSEQKATNALTGRSFGGFLQKPFSPNVLVKTVVDCLDENTRS